MSYLIPTVIEKSQFGPTSPTIVTDRGYLPRLDSRVKAGGGQESLDYRIHKLPPKADPSQAEKLVLREMFRRPRFSVLNKVNLVLQNTKLKLVLRNL